ncbi:MAG: hypothetical protein LBQ66_04730, partial [Planctomycetaceae bacterium]|nr:hypothetical protein [Planctomycetaceae bacterium]
MKNNMKRTIINVVVFIQAILIVSSVWADSAGRIDREALVKRHTVRLDKISGSELPQVGNGEIAFGIDATGLQTFHGNTMSQWGWHSVPCPVEGKHAALKPENFDFHGRALPYRTSPKGQEKLFAWMRENPHRMNLGRVRFLLTKSDSKLIAASDV